MILKWPIHKIAEAPLQILDGDRGKNYPKHTDFQDSGHCLFLDTGNVTRAGFNFDRCQFITESKDEVLKKGKLLRGDVIMTTRGTIGNVAYFSDVIPFEHVRINSGMVIFRPHQEELLPEFLYQFLRSVNFRRQVDLRRTGAAQPQLPIRDIKNISIPVPTLSTQHSIAQVLATYDELIEINQRRIALLEQAGREIYREWFVRLRFPGHERTKIVDGVPEAWERVNLSRLVSTQYGYTASASEEPVGPKFLRGTDINKRSYVDWATVPYCPEDGLDFEKYALKRGDLLVIRMADPGKVAIIEREIRAIFASYLVRLSVQKDAMIDPLYLFHVLAGAEYQGFMQAASAGSTRKSASAKLLTNFNVLRPPETIQTRFVDQIRPMREMIGALLDQNPRASMARDLLLPRLMSGQLMV